MKMITLCVISALLCASAFARIGETEDEIRARYGKPVNEDRAQPPIVERGYLTSGMIVVVMFIDGKSEAEMFMKAKNFDQLSDEEVQLLLKANSNGKEWTDAPTGALISFDQVWRIPDLDRTAQFSKLERKLIVCSGKYLAAQKAQKEAETAAKLKSF